MASLCKIHSPQPVCYPVRFFIFVCVLLGLIESRGLAEPVSPMAWLNGDWNVIGRAKIQTTPESVIISGGFLADKQTLDDAEISFKARAPLGTEQVQIWAGFRFRDRDSRYVCALRGGNDNDLYLARYAPDGEAKFLGFAPLDFKPKPGTWYQLRIVTLGNRFLVFLNNETLPRLNVVDNDMLWTQGGAVLGGGWLPTEFSDVQMGSLPDGDRTATLAIGAQRLRADPPDKETLRQKERSQYTAARIGPFTSPRSNFSLNGNWLFMPDYLLPARSEPVQLDYDDETWHVMPVPSFWTPALAWLHGETGFPRTDEFSKTKGEAESLYVQRIMQCDACTFDWHRTRATWYRHYLELPADTGQRHFELTFGAIAKISDVWINGIEVANHTGMFGQIKCDITRALKPGRNVVAVHVFSAFGGDEDNTNGVEGVAVTVDVTSNMLNSLPHGMFQNDVGGIWQPVTLTATAPVFVNDCFIEPGLHGAKVNLEILNNSQQSASLSVAYAITSYQGGDLLYSNLVPGNFLAATGQMNHLVIQTPYLQPKLWSPQDPNLYNFDIVLKEQNKVIDNYRERFGFRTFTVDGDRLLLNGHPFWLRGADPFPNALCPNDKALADRFMQMARAGNVVATRSHIVPFTSTWLDAADEAGMAVSFEGTWPWLMLAGRPPGDELIDDWRDEYISLIKEYRNHPSIILWTVNNEMKFERMDERNPRILKKKWTILNDAIKAMREADPTRPVIADSSYVRKEALLGYRNLVEPDGLDDGDIDDVHSYYGWYEESFFHLYDGEFKEIKTAGRPLISQEMSTGYPNNDDGHPARFYLFKNYTPQALVGDDAYEDADPSIFLDRQAFMTKELAETLRRTSHTSASGILFFSYFTWFQTPWQPDKIKPWPTYYALKTALQPVLVSAELYGRHFYSDSAIRERVCVVNDSEDCQNISDGHLIWEFRQSDKVLSQGTLEVPSVPYYENRWLNVTFETPRELPAPRIDGQLVLRLVSRGITLSQNSYEVVIASRAWAQGTLDQPANVFLWNPDGHRAFDSSDARGTEVNSIQSVDPAAILVVGGLERKALDEQEKSELMDFISQGGHVLMLHPGARLANLFPDAIQDFKAKDGEIVTMHVPESPVFSGIEPLDLAWFGSEGRRLPVACEGIYQINEQSGAVALAGQCDIHGYLKVPSDIQKYSGTPLVELHVGRGTLIASELDLESGNSDPIPERMLNNLIQYLASEGKQQPGDIKSPLNTRYKSSSSL